MKKGGNGYIINAKIRKGNKMPEFVIAFLMGSAIIVFLLIFLKNYNKMIERQNFIICPNLNCGYRGSGVKSGGSSGCLLIILLLLGILPGILYLLFCGKPGIVCPKCGMKIR